MATAFAWKQGQTLPTWPFQCNNPVPAGQAPQPSNLTSATLALYLRSNAVGVDNPLTTGQIQVTNASQGQFTYAPVAGDTLTLPPGAYGIWLKATYPPIAGVVQEQWWYFGDVQLLVR